jgi:hypothetical protein
MNERIRQLYNQSGGLVRMYDGKLTYFPAYQKNVGDGNFEFSSFDPAKFAELIVRECVAICQDTDGEDNIDARSGRQDCAVEIRDHFGVEE